MTQHKNITWMARAILSLSFWMICLPGEASDVPGQNGQGELTRRIHF